MPTTHKSSPRRRASSKKSQNFALLSQQVRKVNAKVDELVGLMLAKQSTPRSPLPEYAKVVAIGTSPEVSEIRGRTGIVLDAALDSIWTYTVYFPSQQQAFVLPETSLWDTGQTVPEDVIYAGGESRHVRVDSTGKSTLVA